MSGFSLVSSSSTLLILHYMCQKVVNNRNGNKRRLFTSNFLPISLVLCTVVGLLFSCVASVTDLDIIHQPFGQRYRQGKLTFDVVVVVMVVNALQVKILNIVQLDVSQIFLSLLISYQQYWFAKVKSKCMLIFLKADRLARSHSCSLIALKAASFLILRAHNFIALPL